MTEPEDVNSNPRDGIAAIVSRFGFKQDVWFVKKAVITDGVVIGIRGRMEIYGDPEIEVKVRQTHGEVACEEWMPESDCFSTANECVQALINSIPDGALSPTATEEAKAWRPVWERLNKYKELHKNMRKLAKPGDCCPNCGAPEVPYNGPQTVYSCGSHDLDRRPGTLVRSDLCTKTWIDLQYLKPTTNDPRKEEVRDSLRPSSADNQGPNPAKYDPIKLPNGSTMYAVDNEMGGRVYVSDEVGGGVVIWDTAITDSTTILAAVMAELKFNTRG